MDLFGLDQPGVWETELAYKRLKDLGQADSKRTAERRLHQLRILPAELKPADLEDELGRKLISKVLDWDIKSERRQRRLVLFAQLFPLPGGMGCLHANDARGARYWVPLTVKNADAAQVLDALRKLQRHLDRNISVYPHASMVAPCRSMTQSAGPLRISLLAYQPVVDLAALRKRGGARHNCARNLAQLEAESLHILREAVAESENPVLLYSAGKDSSVLLHLARKAFHPSRPPFPLLHVDTRWKFQEMYQFRDAIALESGMDLLVHINPDAIARGINPFDHGSALHTDITKTEGLKQALDKYKFDVVFGGARRDEEKSRAKERIFSFRSSSHRWDPKNQRPELWDLYNTRKQRGESLRVFPLSNWTELDVWQYIYQEDIPVVPLYFSKVRPVVVRDGLILLIDDERMRLLPGERIEARKVRFRTLGCYPLTGAVSSGAQNVAEIILELVSATQSERQGRAIDADVSASMEKKKQEGYF